MYELKVTHDLKNNDRTLHRFVTLMKLCSCFWRWIDEVINPPNYPHYPIDSLTLKNMKGSCFYSLYHLII